VRSRVDNLEPSTNRCSRGARSVVCAVRSRCPPKALATLLVAVFLAPNEALCADKFASVWKGKGEFGSRMTLRLLRELPAEPSEGWLNGTEGKDPGDGDFEASRIKPAKFSVQRGPIVFEAERRGKYPAARYSWRDGVLTICMLSFTPGVFDGRAGIPVRVDYSLCATMQKVDK
jgi:hypothetical protein